MSSASMACFLVGMANLFAAINFSWKAQNLAAKFCSNRSNLQHLFLLNSFFHLFKVTHLPRDSTFFSNSTMSLISLTGLLNTFATFPILGYCTNFAKDWVLEIMKTGPVPKHVALIMDGNRTYAQKMNLPLRDGHFAGAESLILVRKQTLFFLFLFFFTSYT